MCDHGDAGDTHPSIDVFCAFRGVGVKDSTPTMVHPQNTGNRRKLSERPAQVPSLCFLLFLFFLSCLYHTHTPLSMCSMCSGQRLSDVR